MLRIILQSIPVIIFSYTGQVLMKRGVNSFDNMSWDIIFTEPFRLVTMCLCNWWIICGFISAGIGAIFYLFVLYRTDLTIALPVLGALGFLILPLIGKIFLQETITLGRMLGTILISVGMIIVSRS